MSGIEIPVITAQAAIAQTNAWAASLDKVTRASEQAGSKVAAEFGRMQAGIKAAIAATEKAETVFSFGKGIKQLSVTVSEQARLMKALTESLLSANREYQRLKERNDAYDVSVQQGISLEKIRYAALTATTQAIEKQQIALVKADAQLQAVYSHEAKSLAITNALIASRERLNRAIAGNNPTTINQNASAAIYEAQSKAAIKAKSAVGVLNAEHSLYLSLLGRGVQTIQATVNVEKARYDSLVRQAEAERRLKIELKETVHALDLANSATSASIARNKERLKGIEQAVTFDVRQNNALAELTRTRESLNIGTAKNIALAKEEIRGLEQSIVFEQRLLNSEKALRDAKLSLNGGTAERIAKLKEENKGIEQSIVFEQRLLNSEKALRDAKLSLNGGTAERIAKLKEENKGIEQSIVFEQRLLNSEKALRDTKLSLNGGTAERIAKLREENKGIEQSAVFEQHLLNSEKALRDIKLSLNGGTAERIAKLKEENKGIEQSIVFEQRLLNSEKALRDAKLSLNGGTAERIAKLKEENKGIEQSIVFEQRLLNSEKALRDARLSLNGGTAERIAKLKEENKGIEQSITFEQRLLNSEQALKDVKASLNGGTSERIAKLKEENKGIEQQATLEQRLLNKQQELLAMNKSLANGTASSNAVLREQNKYLEQSAVYATKLTNEANMLRLAMDPLNAQLRANNIALKVAQEMADRLAKTNAELAYATGRLTKVDWERLQTNTQTLAGLKAEATFADRMKNKYEELARSVDYLKTKKGELATQMSIEERLQKRLNELIAFQQPQIQRLVTAIKQLETEESKLITTNRALNASFNATQQGTASLRATLAGLGASFGSYTSATLLVSIATYALVRNMREVATVGMEFEDAITRVAAISTKAAFSSDVYQSSLERLEARAIEVAASTRFMAGEVTKAMSEMAMAGLSAEEILVGVRDVMNLAAIGAIGFGESADIATNILMGFQLHISQLTDVVDKMALAVTSSNQNISQLGNALSYVAPIASAFGVGMDIVIASTEVLANAGIKASRAGTAMRRVLVSLFTPTEKGSKAMKQMGIDVVKVADGFEDLEGLEGAIGTNIFGGAISGTEILTDRLKQLYVMTAGATTNIGLLNDIVGMRALPAFIQLIKSLDDGTKSLFELQNALEGAGGMAESTMRKMADTLKNDWLVFKGAIEAVQQSLFSLESDNLRELVVGFTGSVQMLARNKDYLQEMVTAAKALGESLVKLLGLLLAVKVAMAGWTLLNVLIASTSGLTASLMLLAPASWATAAGFTQTALAATAATSSLARFTAMAPATAAALAGLSAGSLGFSTAISAAMLGVVAGLKAVAKGVLFVFTRLILPAAILYGLWKLADYFFNIEDSIFGVIDATGKMNDQFKETQQALNTEAEILVGGGLEDLYNQLNAEKALIPILKKKNESYGNQAEAIKRATDEMTRLSSEINTAHETLKLYGQYTLFPLFSKDRAALDEANAQLDAMLSKRRELAQAAQQTTQPRLERRYTSEGSALDEDIRRQQAAIEDLAKAAELSQLRYERAVGTTIERLADLNLAYADTNASISGHKTRLDALQASYANMAALSSKYRAAGNNTAVAALTRSMATISAEADVAREAIAHLNAVSEEYYAQLQSLTQSQPVTLEFQGQIIEELATSFTRLRGEAKLTSGELEAMQFSASARGLEQLERTITDSLDKVNKAYEDLAKSDNPNSFEGMQKLNELISELAGQLQDFGKQGLETAAELLKLEAKYDDTVKATQELSAATWELGTLYVGGRGGIEDFTDRLKKQLGETLKLDEATGQLTETSRKTVLAYRTMVNELIGMQQTKLTDMLSLDPKQQNSREIERVELRLESLRAAYALLGTDLTGLIATTKTAREEEKDLKDLYQDQIDVLNLLGEASAALALTREKEIKTADKSQASILKLKHALEDLEQAKTDAFDASAFTEELQDFFYGLPDQFKGTLGAVKVNWFDPAETVANVNGLRENIATTFGQVKSLGAEITEALEASFKTLSQRLEEISAQALKAISEISLATAQVSSGGGVTSASTSKVPASAIDYLLDAIGQAEAPRGYDQVYSPYEARKGQQTLTDKTIQEIYTLQSQMLKAVGGSVVGRYQFTKDTLKSDVAALKISLDTKFDADTQDRLATYELLKAGVDDWAAGAKSDDAFQASVAKVWAGVPQGASNRSAYEGFNGNSATIKDAQWDAAAKAAKEAYAGVTPVVAAATSAITDNSAALTQDARTAVVTAAAHSDVATQAQGATFSVATLTETARALDPAIQLFGSTQELAESLKADVLSHSEQFNTNLEAYEKTLAQTSQQELTNVETKERLSEQLGLLSAQYAQLEAEKEQLYKLETREIALGQQRTYSFGLDQEQIKSLSSQYGTLASNMEAFRVDRARLIALYQADAIGLDELTDKLREFADEVQSSQGAWSEYWVELKNDIEDLDGAFVDVFDSFKDNLVDALVDGEMNFDSFVDTVKRKLAELAINTIVVNVIGNITGISSAYASLTDLSGATGAAGAAGTASSGLSGVGALGKLSSVWSWLNSNSLSRGIGYGYDTIATNLGGSAMSDASANALASTSNMALLGSTIVGGLAGYFAGTSLFEGKYVSTGSAIGGSGGAAAGAAIGSVFPVVGTIIGGVIGGLLGGTAGGWIGSLFGSDEPRFGGYASSFSGQGLEDNVKATGSFGLNFGISDKGTKNIKAADYQETLDGLAKVSNYLAEFYGEDLSNSIQTRLRDRLGDFNDWGDSLEEYFRQIFGTIMVYGDEATGDANSVGKAMTAAMDGLGGFGGSVQEMAQKIEDGIAIVYTARDVYGTGFGKLLGMADDMASNDLSKASAELARYVTHFRETGETAAAVLSKMVTNVYALTAAMGTAGKSIKDFIGSGYAFVAAANDFVDRLGYFGSSIETLSNQQETYYANFFSEEEQAAIKRRAALDQINELNESFGLTGESAIDTKTEVRDLIESLDLTTEAGQAAYIQLMNVIDAFVALEASGASVTDFIKSITPEDVTGAESLKEMMALFDSWGMSMPGTSDALYDLIQAGKLTTDQIQALADKSDTLTAAWGYVATLQQQIVDNLVDKLTEAYDRAVEAANDRSDAYLDSLNEASDAYLERLKEQYDAVIEGLEDKIDVLNDSLEDFASIITDVAASLESLLQQTEGPDVTRQRYIDMARQAIETISKGGAVPDNLSEIISQLGSVDQNDFANREDWMAAIRENEAVLSELQKLAGSRKSGVEAQIELLERQIEQQETQYDAAVKAEEARLERLIAAEEARLEEELAALEKEFDKNKQAIEDSAADTLIALLEQTGALNSIDLGISNVTELLQDILDKATGDSGSSKVDDTLVQQMVKLVDSMGREKRAPMWQDIIDLVSNEGTKGVPMPELGFTSDFDKISRLIKLWESSGLFDANDKRDIRARLYKEGIIIPGFSKGGKHAGGWRMVGEAGPELEYTGASRIFSNTELAQFLERPGVEGTDYSKYVPAETGARTEAALLAEVQALREEVAALRSDTNAGHRAVAANTAKASAMFDRWEQIGMPQARDDIYEVTP